MSEDAGLSEEQKAVILDILKQNPDEPPFLRDLSKAAFGKEVDGRSREGKLIKEFLAKLNFNASFQNQTKDDIILSDAQKEYIVNNVTMMNSLEMAKELFNDKMLTNLHKETRAVNDYVKTLDKKIVYGNPDEVPSDAVYRPPRTFDTALRKINRYIHGGIDKAKITSRQNKEVNALIGYMNTYRFGHQINTYTSNTDRELFESSFIRYTYDKSDLTQEEVDQYIVLSMEVVISSNIQATILSLQELLARAIDNPDGAKISIGLSDSITSARTEYNQCVARQQKLLNDLKQKRSDRLKNQIQENASIINLVLLFKEEESRVKLLKLANLRRQSLENEIERLSTMDEIKCKILGISREEVLDG